MNYPDSNWLKLSKFLLFFLLFSGSSQAKTVDISIISDGDSPWMTQLSEAVKAELSSFSDSTTTFNFPESTQHAGDWTRSTAQKLIRRELANPRTEIVIALGIATSSAASDVNPSKPLIATAVINPKAQGFEIDADGTSGTTNLHFLTLNADVNAQLSRFINITDAKKVGIVVQNENTLLLPGLNEEIGNQVAIPDVEIEMLVRAQEPLVDFFAALPSDVDALFVLPQLDLSAQGQEDFADLAITAKLPTFSMLGVRDVEQGLLMGQALVPSADLLSRRLAVDVRDISLGRSASDLNVGLKIKERLVLNLDTAAKIDYQPSFDTLNQAEILNAPIESASLLTIQQAITESLEKNLGLKLAGEDLKLQEQSAKIAQSDLLPQITGSIDVQRLDRDLALTGPDETSSYTVTATQSLYSEGIRSNYVANKYLLEAQRSSLDSSKLALIRDAASSFIAVAIAQSEFDIQLENLKLTQANLDRAIFRYEIGSTNRAEVFRFENELAENNRSVTSARGSLMQAKAQLNQLLHRPIRQDIFVDLPALSVSPFFGDSLLEGFLNNPQRVETFADFLTQKGIENSPDLAAIESRSSAQERLLLAAKRKRFIPDVTLVGTVENVFDDEGATLPTDFDDDWSVGLQFSWTLYQGSKINAEKRQEQIRLDRLALEYENQLEQIASDTRTNLAAAGSSRQNINYAKVSAEAAAKNLDLVTDAYERGTSSYIDLIDAQNAQLTSKLAFENAGFTHLNDLVQLQSAISFFDFFTTPATRDEWLDDLIRFIDDSAE
ncbi:MAG: TolC family protein [Pseudomonadota bacterium]